jgi:hypothetical protein
VAPKVLIQADYWGRSWRSSNLVVKHFIIKIRDYHGGADFEERCAAGGIDNENGLRGSPSGDPQGSRMNGGTKGWRLRGVEWRVKLGILPDGDASIDAILRATADGRRK